mmetsp:Transcript_66171/g.158277  ORF Transcript_66171/g.158277 Transcript_66171/m.158277 type:complete len:160 (+) Transcript_66171:81-560(+)
MWCRSCCQNDDTMNGFNGVNDTMRLANLEEEIVGDTNEIVPPASVSETHSSMLHSKESAFADGPLEYRVQIAKVDGRLGIVVGYTDEDDAVARVTKILDGSAMDSWNKANPSRQVLVEYAILEVNGVMAAPAICDEIRRSSELNMLVRKVGPDDIVPPV